MDAAATLLHNRGSTALHEVPTDWCVVEFCNAQHAEWCDRIVGLLEEVRDRWGESDASGRVGTVAAELVSRRLLAEHGCGIWITATHPSVDAATWEVSGPRFYASIIDSARGRSRARAGAPPAVRNGICDRRGKAPRPPRSLARLLWPMRSDGEAPWITELGWTIVPPHSPPQDVHADIVATVAEREAFPRAPGRGRFHHMAWKRATAAPQQSSCVCTTRIVAGAFPADGTPLDAHYAALAPVAKARAVIIDSEMLHGGAATHSGEWSSTCTVQLCSTSGWPALHSGGRADPDLLTYTIPITTATASTGKTSEEEEEVAVAPAAKRRRVADAGPGTMATTKLNPLERAAIDAAMAAARAAAGATWWRGEGAAGSSTNEQTAAATTTRTTASETSICHTALCTSGLHTLPRGMPRAWSTDLVHFVDVMHAAYADAVAAALAAAAAAPPAALAGAAPGRPGERAAQCVSAMLKRRGVGLAVYVPPPSREEEPPYNIAAPRFYVGCDDAAARYFGASAPSLPASLARALWPEALELEQPTVLVPRARVRSLGWTLAPPCSPPQTLHADIWGVGAGHCEVGSVVRFPHLLWKSDKTKRCTTEIAPAHFTQGVCTDGAYDALVRSDAPAIVVNAEVLHRGARTGKGVSGAGVGADAGAGWVSTCSLELCSGAGWNAWVNGSTGGTTIADGGTAWRMLPIGEVES